MAITGHRSRISAPILSALIAVPLVVLYPVLLAWLGLAWLGLAWLGFGPISKIVFGIISGVFPIALNTLTACRISIMDLPIWQKRWAPIAAKSCSRLWRR
jgi:ABC-type nitrate/sulfonate/bicarbonate transport system permease component